MDHFAGLNVSVKATSVCSIGSTRTAKSGRFSTSSLIRTSNLTFPTMPTLRPKLRNVPRRSFSRAMVVAWTCRSTDGKAVQ